MPNYGVIQMDSYLLCIPTVHNDWLVIIMINILINNKSLIIKVFKLYYLVCVMMGKITYIKYLLIFRITVIKNLYYLKNNSF